MTSKKQLSKLPFFYQQIISFQQLKKSKGSPATMLPLSLKILGGGNLLIVNSLGKFVSPRFSTSNRAQSIDG